MAITVAEALAEGMCRHGIREIFGQSVPSALLLAAERRGIRQISYRTENAGGAMADGYARVAHRPVVTTAQNGPGAALLVPPLAEALKASTPVVAIVQEVPVGQRDRNAFQELDHHALFAACTKWRGTLDDPGRADDYLDMAFIAATAGRPGPVALLVPKDVLTQEAIPQRPRTAALDRVPLDRPRPSADAVRTAADILLAARRPLVVAGGGVHGSQATAELGRLQELAALPVATTVMGKGALAEDGPLSAGVIGYFMGERGMAHGLREWLSDVDAVLLVGTRTNENGTDGWRALPERARYIHLDVDPGEVGRNYESLRLVGDARAGLADLTAELGSRDLARREEGRAELVHALSASRTGFAERTADVRGSAASPIRPERIMAEIDRVITDETVVVADASYSSIWVANYLRARIAGQRFITPRGIAGLGWGLPMALGVKAARPHSPVICVSGDGGFAHVWSELDTAVRERLPVVLMVLNNAVLGYQKHAEVRQFGKATSAVDLRHVDHVAIARACGAIGETVTDPAELARHLPKALAEELPVLLDVHTDPEAYPPVTDWDGDTRLPD